MSSALDSSGGKSRSGGGVALKTISECVAELQAALTTIEAGGAGSLSTSGSSHESVHDKFSATKSLFYCLVRLNVLILHSHKDTLLPLEGLCVSVVSTMLQARRLTLSAAFRGPIADFYAAMLAKSTTVNLYTVIKDMQGLLMASKTVPSPSRVAAMEVLARVFRHRARQLSPTMVADCMVVISKQLRSSDACLREAALVAIAAGGVAGKQEIFKALRGVVSDKSVEVKGGLAQCLMGLVKTPEDLSGLSLDSLLTLCLKGLEDSSVQVQLLFARAMAHFLSLSVAGSLIESKARIIKSARGDTDDSEGAGGSGGGAPQSGVEKAMAKLKDMGGPKRSSSASTSTGLGAGHSFTLESGVSYLICLFLRAAAGAPFSQGSIGAVMVAFLRSQREGMREDTMQWLLSVLLSSVTRVGLGPPSAPTREELSTRLAVSHILRQGLAAGSPEALQLALARSLLRLLTPDSSLNSHQLQLVLVEIANLVRCLEESSSCLVDALQPRLLELLRHLSYGVRFEAAVTLQALASAHRHLSAPLCRSLVDKVRHQYEALAELMDGPNGPTTPDGEGEEDEGNGNGNGNGNGRPMGNVPPAEVKRLRSHETERRSRICALHGCSNALVLLLKGLPSLQVGVPPRLLEDAMAVAKQLVNQQFSVCVRKWATCVRAGWSILSGILYQGPHWAVKYIRILFQLFGRSMELEGSRSVAEGTEPSNLLESMLGTLLVFVRQCPQVLWTAPGALSATVELLDRTLQLLHARGINNKSQGGALRVWLVKSMVMECYAWLPPGSYPASSHLLFKWATSTVCELIAPGGVGGDGSGNGPSAGPTLTQVTATAPLDVSLDNSILPQLVSKEDEVLDVKSSYRGSLQHTIEVDVSPEVLALQAHVCGLPLEDREKDAAIATGQVGCPSQWAPSPSAHVDPPTPLHAHCWVRPPLPHACARIRLLDAALCLLGATFGHQSNDWQTQAVERVVSLLPASLVKGDEKGGAVAVMSVLTSTEEDRRRKDERQAQVCRNVVTALLSMLQPLPTHTHSRSNTEVAWVPRMRESLLCLLGSPHPMTRRAASESLALLSHRMGNPTSLDSLLQTLVETATRREPPPSGATSAALMLKGVSSLAGSTLTMHYRAAGACFALACLRRTLGTQVRLSVCWAGVQRIMIADAPPPLRTWGLHALLLLLRSMSLGQNFGVVTHDTLQTLDTIMEVLEAHFLAPWAHPTSGSEHEPGLLLCLARLMNALLPMITDLQPHSPCLERFKALWGVLRLHDDSRVALECLQFIELLSLFSPKDVAPGPALDFLRNVLSCRPYPKSRACLSTALSCLRCLAKREGRSGFRKQHLEVLLLSVFEGVASSLHWEGAPLWRFAATPRDVERYYYDVGHLLEEVRATLDVVVGSDGRRGLHYILLARALILGGSHARAAAADQPVSSLAPRRSQSMDDDAGGDHGNEAQGGGGGTEPLADRLRRSAAEVVATLPASRWQLKVVAVELLLQALRLVVESGGSPVDIVRARELAARTNNPVLSSSDFNSSGSGVGPSAGEEGVLIGLFLEDLVAVACSAAGAVVDDQPLPCLQEHGVLLLKAVLLLFGRVPDPDAITPDGIAPPVLQQFSSQLTSALTPGLTCPFRPSLVSASTDVVLSALSSRLVEDPIVARRLLNQMLPSPQALDPSRVCMPAEPLADGPSDHETPDDASTSTPLPLAPSLAMHNVRLCGAAQVYILTQRGSLGAETREALMKILDKLGEGLAAHWLAAVIDAVRLLHDTDLWPALCARAVKAGGRSYDTSVDPTTLLPYYAQSWPFMCAALALYRNRGTSSSGGGMGPSAIAECQLLWAIVETAIQSAADSGGMTGAASRGGMMHATHAAAQGGGHAAGAAGGGPSAFGHTPTTALASLAWLSPPDDHRGLFHVILALDALLRPPFLEIAEGLGVGQLVRLLRALAHGPCLRPESPTDLHLLTASFLVNLLSEQAPFLRRLLEQEAGEVKGEAEKQGAREEEGEGEEEEEEESGEGGLWMAMLEGVFVPLCRLLPGLFADEEGQEPGPEGEEEDEESEGEETQAAPTPSAKSQVFHLPLQHGHQRQHSQQLGHEAALQCPLFLRCLEAVTHLPPLCPPGVEGAAFPTFIAVAVRVIKAASASGIEEEAGKALLSTSCALLHACSTPLARHALLDAATSLLPPLLQLTHSPLRLRALLEGWLALLDHLWGQGEEVTVQRCLATLAQALSSYDYPTRHVLLSCIRAAIQLRPGLASPLFRLFGPPATLLLFTPLREPGCNDALPAGTELYLGEAIKLLFQAFATLPCEPPERLASLQGQHLAVLLPALMHFLSHTVNALDAACIQLLTTLVSHALLSIARNAPQAFKEQVQVLPAATRQKLESVLRAQSAPAARGGATAKPLRIDLSQYKE